MRALTVTPTDQGWIALGPPVPHDWEPTSGMSSVCRVCGTVALGLQGEPCPALFPGDVLAVVKRWLMFADAKETHGTDEWRLTGFVRVVEVLPIVGVAHPEEPLCESREPHICVGWDRVGVALRVETCECPTCGGDVLTPGEFGTDPLGVKPCGTCTGPITVTGTGPIVEAN